ncbi:MAG: hypothetical protein ABI647_19435 [Gemmatimonadota bacterium]
MDDVWRFFGVMMTIVISVVTLVTAFTVLKRVSGGKRAPALAPPELDLINARLDNVEALERRVAELEERLDFTERVLSQHRETARLPGA